MAKVSHHAMRRYPAGPLDSNSSSTSSATNSNSYSSATNSAASGACAGASSSASSAVHHYSSGTTNGATSGATPIFYSSPSQRVTVVAPTDNSNNKSSASSPKKTWGQRLKITKSDKTPSPTNNFLSSDILDYENLNGPQSALSRSMKYTETYLYGTVRGIPAPRANGGGVIGPAGIHFGHHFPAEVAVVVCSCPEFLNGTKRELKKASICKKCKGSRLPLAPIGGTMRIHSSAAIVSTPSRTSAGTMRLLSTSGKKSRPSILSAQNDPYDLMRRNRLVSPDLKSVKPGAKDAAKFKNRAKSQSPSRGRNKNRKRSPSPNENSINSENHRSRSATRNGGGGGQTKECWIDITETEMTARRSILRCEINPYDLISKRSQNFNEFSPSHDEDNFHINLELSSRKYETILDQGVHGDSSTAQHNYKNVAAIAGQRMRLFGKTKIHTFEEPEKYIYDPIEVQSHTTMPHSPTKALPLTATPTDLSQSRLNHRALSPVRPPRRKQERSGDEQQSTQQQETFDTSPVNELIAPAATAVGEPQYNGSIKSILKRPSLTPENSVSARDGENDQQPSHMSGGEVIAPNRIGGNSSSERDRDKKNSGSQFYLPLPSALAASTSSSTSSLMPIATKPKSLKTTTIQVSSQSLLTSAMSSSAAATTTRKKVQFVVENEIIQDDEDEEEPEDIMGDDGGNLYDVVHNDVDCDVNGGLNFTNISNVVIVPSSASVSVNGGSSSSSVTICGTSSSTQLNREANTNPAQNSNATDLNSLRNVNKSVIGELMKKHQNAHAEELKSKSKTELNSSPTTTTVPTSRIGGGGRINSSSEDSNEDDSEKLELPQMPQRNCVLRRSFSDRRTKMRNSINFLDTTALRNRPVRVDSRQIFEEEAQLRSSRPRDPPPPVPERRSRRSAEDEDNIYEDFCIKTNENATTINVNKTIVNITSPPSAAKSALQSPLVINRESAAIHRLEIKHNDHADMESLKKTSIMISGDDCYSTVNVNDSTPLYQSSVVVNDEITQHLPGISKTSSNTITISVSSPKITAAATNGMSSLSSSSTSRTAITAAGTTTTIANIPLPLTSSANDDEDLIYKNNKKNSLLNINSLKSIIPIGGNEIGSCHGLGGGIVNDFNLTKSATTKSNSRTFISADYDNVSSTTTPQTASVTSAPQSSPAVKESQPKEQAPNVANDKNAHNNNNDDDNDDIEIILRNPVEAIKRNLVPHVCGRPLQAEERGVADVEAKQQPQQPVSVEIEIKDRVEESGKGKSGAKVNIISKLLEDPTLGHLAEGLEEQLITKLIENSLIRLKESRSSLDMSGTKDEEDVTKMIDMSLQKIQEQKQKLESSAGSVSSKRTATLCPPSEPDRQSNRSSMSSGNSYGSASYELMEFDNSGDLSDCYQSCSSDLTTDDDATSTRSKFYQMLVDATLSEIETTTAVDDDHHYESIRLNCDPIYEEIHDVPPPLPLSSPPLLIDDPDFEKKNNSISRSIFEGASKYDILSYLVDAKERGIVAEELYTYNFNNANDIILEEEDDDVTVVNHQKMSDRHQRQISDVSSRISQLSTTSDSSEDNSSISTLTNEKALSRKQSADIERNDSGVGSETSKTSRSKWQHPSHLIGGDKSNPMHLCEDCDGAVETQVTDSGVMYAPLVCRKCGKKRAERKEILTEIVETEEKYGRDLQIILEEFYQPMLVAGLLTQDQLSAIFLNTEELLENNQSLAERMRDAFDIANEQGDDDLVTVNIGKIFLEAAPMLHAFESYCVRQGAASLLLANLEKEKELLRIFLRVSQMENTVLRRMNLNSFLMVPVQRVTKYPLLLARLFKVTPHHLEGRELLKQAQEKIELHLNHMNREAKDVPTKLWRRISSSSPGRRSTCEIDMINIKLRKMAVDILEWNHEEVRFALEGRLLFTQPTDNNWRKGRTIKLAPINALLVTNGKPSANYKADRSVCEPLNFPRHTGIREASLLLVREKSGRYTLLREPLYLDRCIICTETEWEDYFEVQEVVSKDTFIFKAEDGTRTKQWYTQLQYHSQGMGAWRKRRNALANIMINGMMTRT